MLLSELLATLPFHQINNQNQINVTGIEMDSRKVTKGNLFVCIKGFTVDGHDYVKQAEERGACAVIAERPLDISIPVIIVPDSSKALAILADRYYQHPTQKFKLIGVTGTNGKTTVTYLLENIFKVHKQKTALIGTIQMKIGDESFEVKNTTPDSLFLQRNFHKMVEENVETVMMEVSSHALDLGRVHGCDFDIAIFTNLSQDHLDYHENMDDYLRAKSLLFSQLGNAYLESKKKLAIINKDDSSSTKLIKSTAQPVLTYGIDGNADIRATDMSLTAHGSSFNLCTPVGEIFIDSKLMGKFSVYNLLAAAGGAIAAGVPLATIKQALEATKGVSGRFEAVRSNQAFGVIVDYAHTPDSLENVLSTIQTFVKGKIIVVVGCGGDRDKKKRPLMAKIAVKNSQLAIFTSDNPRSEEPRQIIKDMEAGVEGESYQVILDRKEAIEHAIDIATPDDVILIAGKGHETYQQIGDQVLDFDDRLVAKTYIEEKLKRG